MSTNINSSRKNSTRIALRLQQLEAEHVIQQREWEAIRRTIEQERKTMHDKYKLLEERLANRRKTTKPKSLDRAVVPSVPTTEGSLHSGADVNKSSSDNVPKQNKSVDLVKQHFGIQAIGTNPSVDRPPMNEIQQRKCRAFLNISSTVSALPCDANVKSLYDSRIPFVLCAILQSILPSVSTTYPIITQPNLFKHNQASANGIKTKRPEVLRAKLGYCIRSSSPPGFVESNAPDPAPPPVNFIDHQ